MKTEMFVVALRLYTSSTDFTSNARWTLIIRRSRLTKMPEMEPSEFHWLTPLLRSKATSMSRLP